MQMKHEKESDETAELSSLGAAGVKPPKREVDAELPLVGAGSAHLPVLLGMCWGVGGCRRLGAWGEQGLSLDSSGRGGGRGESTGAAGRLGWLTAEGTRAGVLGKELSVRVPGRQERPPATILRARTRTQNYFWGKKTSGAVFF